MTVQKYPALIWRDHAGLFTAALVESVGLMPLSADEIIGVAPTSGEALGQLERFLTWKANKDWLPESEVQERKLIEVVVHLKPQHTVLGRSYPAERNIRLAVECVWCHLGDELRMLSLPRFDERLYFYEGESIKELVVHHLQSRFRGQSPSEISRYLPPKSAFLGEVQVSVPAKRSWKLDLREDNRDLVSVADPLDSKKFRRLIGPAWERDEQVRDLTDRLTREGANVIIVGESGSGKTAVLAETVKRISRAQPSRGPHRFWLTGASRLIAGMKYLGQWEQRCQLIIEALEDIDGTLCVENLLELIQVGGTGPGDSIAAFFAPYLQAGELRLVGEATPSELDACQRLLPGFAGLFQVLRLPEMERATALSIFERLGELRSSATGRTMELGLPDLIYQLHRRFYPYAAFPGRAARFLLDLYDRALVEGRDEVSREQALELFVRRTGLPEVLIRDDFPLSSSEIFEELRGEVIGQDHACRLVADVVTAFKSGLNDPARPVAVLLLCGPTGVGKTQLARTLAAFCFGSGDDGDRMIRLDMSEYAGFGAASRLLGDPRHGGSDLIKRIRQQPFQVVLFDEIEKAAPEVFDVLLNLMDEGRLTDPYGRLTDFRSSIILMTSNLGARSRDPVGFGEAPPPRYAQEVLSFFRPEFGNRIDDIVIFQPLSSETMEAITRKELGQIAEREGFGQRTISLRWTDALVHKLSTEGYDARYGARHLQRSIEERVVMPLSRFLLEGESLSEAELVLDVDGDGRLSIEVDSGRDE